MNERASLSSLLMVLLTVAGAAVAHDGEPHFDAAQHGGVVLQSKAHIHYELVATQGGKQLQVWLSDERRRPIPAAEVTALVVEIGHPGNRSEQVDMRISDDGGNWIGAVNLQDPADIVRVGFTYRQVTTSSSTKYETLLNPPKPPASLPKPAAAAPAKLSGQDNSAACHD